MHLTNKLSLNESFIFSTNELVFIRQILLYIQQIIYFKPTNQN